MLAPVTTPRCCQVTVDWAAITDGLATNPNPSPITKQGPASAQTLLLASTGSSSAAPATAKAPPISRVSRKPMVR